MIWSIKHGNDIATNAPDCFWKSPFRWRELESNEEGEDMNASLDVATTTTAAAKEQEAPDMERKMNAAAIERCQLLKDATKIEFGLLSASNDVSNKCLAALENTIKLECLLVV